MTRRVRRTWVLVAGVLTVWSCWSDEPTAPAAPTTIPSAATALARVQADRTDDVSGSQVHVFYVLPKDGVDRSLDVNGTLGNTVGSFQTWLSGQTSGRILRLDTYRGKLDITFFRMSRTDADLAQTGGFLREAIEGELNAAGLLRSNKIYAVYYDGGNDSTCGSGAWPSKFPGKVGALYLRGTPPGAPACNTNQFASSPSTPAQYLEYAMLHELMHVQGFVDPDAPHEWRDGHVSDDVHDLMWLGDEPVQWNPAKLDAGRDDYFATSLPSGVKNFSQSSFLYRPNSWATKAAMPTAREDLALGAINGIIYAIGGWSGTTALTTVETYSPSGNGWTRKANLPAARFQPDGAGVVNGLLYLPGGFASGSPARETKTLFVYDPATGSWSRKADLPIISACGATGVIAGKLYVTTACDGTTIAAKWLHRYDPATNSWTRLADSPHAHNLPAAGAFSGKLYLAGGFDETFRASSNLDVYDPAMNTWATKVAMPTARGGTAGGFASGKFYVVGGQDANGVQVTTTEVYDPETNTWTRKAPMPTARSNVAAVSVNGLIYVVGGLANGTILGMNRVYTP
jgi:N-acetylneuraminic acid mutarotase